MLYGLDLFSGIGGISFALRKWVQPIAYCESDSYCQRVLLSRMADESLCDAPIWDDITTFQGLPFNGSVDIVYGGFPCQDISIAGLGKGLAGERSSLVYEMLRVVRDTKPRFLFIENVPRIISLGGNEIVKQIVEMGMDCRWACISAQSCGSFHKRDRWFLMAYSDSKSSWETNQETKFIKDIKAPWVRSTRQVRGGVSSTYWKENKHPFPGMDDGLSFELDRAKSLGNCVVLQQTKEAFEILMGLKTSG